MKTPVQKLISSFVLASIVICLGSSSARAQTSGSTILTVSVTDVLLLVVSPVPVPLGLGTATNFTDGTSYVATAQLTASSNHPYDVKVQSDGDLVGQATASGVSIPISNVMVQTSTTLLNTYSNALNLSTSSQVLISSAPAAMAKIYDVKYSTSANNSAFFVKAGAYVANLTYSIVAL